MFSEMQWKTYRDKHDRVQTESQESTADSCFDVIGSHSHGIEAKNRPIHLLFYVSNKGEEELPEVFSK